jgi:hypothetical protein
MRFCTSCQYTRAEEGGEKQRRGKILRWICKGCLEKRSQSKYQKHDEPEKVRELR